jgi:2-C-methyl-D-erythritol 4-phosphate cytidylyltransferase
MYSLALLNGGIGTRVAAGRPKQFIRVNGIPAIVYSLVAADAVQEITQIVVNFPLGWRADVERVVRDYAVKTPITYVEAGSSRQESVQKVLPACTSEKVILHESARPLVTTADFKRLIAAPFDNVSYMLPIPFTVAPVDPETRLVTGYLDRDTLRNVQLPQKFDKATLVKAHEEAKTKSILFTEDATLCVLSGAEVHFIDGSDRNLKVTTKTDVRLAGFLLANVNEGDEDA